MKALLGLGLNQSFTVNGLILVMSNFFTVSYKVNCD